MANNTTNENSTEIFQNSTNLDLSPYCTAITLYFSNPMHVLLIWVHFCLVSAIIILAVGLFWQYAKFRVVVHKNLLILFTNIIVLYIFHALSWFFYNLRYLILLHFQKTPCDLLTPQWMVPFGHAPLFAYTIAFPSFHFTILLERIRATLLADRYEHEGPKMTVLLAIGIWLLSLGYMAYVICSGFADNDLLGHPQGIQLLTSKYNAQPIFLVMVFSLVLIVFTAFCDWRIFVLNRRIREGRKNASSYNLSLNYQLNENAFAMRLILPIDISYALLYPTYVALVAVVRAYKTSLPVADYNFFLHLLNTLLFIHSNVTLIVYIRYVRLMNRIQNRVMEMKAAPENAQIYFKQLERQWN